jgi:hypothetical protein
MKKLIIPAGGHPFFGRNDINHLSQANVETASALASMLGLNYYLTNFALTLNLVTGNTDYAAGWMVYKGEPCQFDAGSLVGVPVDPDFWAWVPDEVSTGPLTYENSTIQNPRITKKVKIIATSVAEPDYVKVVDVKTRAQAMNSILKPTGFVPLGLINDWAAVAGFNTPSIMIEPSSRVSLQGVITKAASTSDIFTTIDPAYRPTKKLEFGVKSFGGGFDFQGLTVETNGNISLSRTGDYNNYSLEGIYWYL